MKILTWNILASEWVKKSYYPTVKDYTLLDSDRRIKLIIKRLRAEDADIILLQEVMDVEYDLLYKQFNREYYVSSLRAIQWFKTKRSSSGNVTLVRKKCKTISESPLEYGIYVKADNISIFNIHLDDESYNKRKRQMDDIRPFLEKEKYTIIGGDFNQEYKKNCPIYKFPKSIVHNKGITYFVEKDMNIDNIITKGFISSYDSMMYVPHDVSEGLRIYGSDHIPVSTVVF
jgi:endonuclease/exonuclease/phosphatase family metal-dependent hydrolase